MSQDDLWLELLPHCHIYVRKRSRVIVGILADSPRTVPFRSLGLDDRIFKAIQEAGYTEPTPIQAAAIPEVLAGRDVIGIAQTGTGKTAAFVLPILTKLARRSGRWKPQGHEGADRRADT